MVTFRYDGKEVIDMAYKLSKMHKSALPNAVRFTLNDAAFDVKKTSLQEEVKKDFILRKPTFFKRFSGVEKAIGWNINKMESGVGIVNDTSVPATKDIATQEDGGKLNRKQIMLPGSRVSGSPKKKVSNKYQRVGGFKNRTAVSKKDYVKGAFAAEGKKKPDHLRYKSKSGKGFIIDIQKITRKRGELKIKSKILGSFLDDRELHIKATNFMQNSALVSAKKLKGLFYKNAQKQIEKFTK